MDDIVDETIRLFGPIQARRYADALIESLNQIPETPRAFPLTDSSPRQNRRKRYRSHNIYFQLQDETIVILRILHTARDPGGLL